MAAASKASGGTGLQPIRQRGSAVDHVVAQLRQRIASGTWTVGSKIPSEAFLASELEVSRPVVRESLRALAHIGLLRTQQGAGTYVISGADPLSMLKLVELADLQHVLELQMALDMFCARQAAQRWSGDDEDCLRNLLKRRDKASNATEFGVEDFAFHSYIAQLTRNPLMESVYAFFGRRIQEGLATIRSELSFAETGPAAHGNLVAAILSRNSDSAGAAAEAVIAPTLKLIRNLLETSGHEQEVQS